MTIALAIRIRGTVQGVGFRPAVYRIAQDLGLHGDVCNDGEGVLIRAVGTQAQIDSLFDQLPRNCPPLARIDRIDPIPLTDYPDFVDFKIRQSLHSRIHTAISPDAATCVQCLSDIFDPWSRWYRYPFTNCTHCGPRLSILERVPYDRSNTSMAVFPLCADCRAHYQEISDRRFHAQPIACHQCGPKVWLVRSDGCPVEFDMLSIRDDLERVCTLLQRGEIVAIKGLGGFHLACDATNAAAVQKLRQRKHRDHKPFALMARDRRMVERYCWLSSAEQALLESPAAPILLLRQKSSPVTPAIAPAVAPGLQELGFMLPYTPLHHLILERMEAPIVLTSGNRSDEPQCITNEAAQQHLSAIADYFLFHDREIVNRVDDSVGRVVQGQVQLLRRARGYAPTPLRLPVGFAPAPAILAMGGELKNTIGLLQGGEAILSQHLGDLENASVHQAYQSTLNLYLHLFDHQPQTIAIDLHPDYLSSQLGRELATANTLTLEPIQHHHAHIAACLADNHIPLSTEPVLGIALDGLGYGADGSLWGGEFLLADYRTFQRLAQLKSVAMIGSAQAIYQPWRNVYAHLAELNWEWLKERYGELELIRFLAAQPRSQLNQLLTRRICSPLASSCGRLFDAVAAALGICRDRASYEGQGAILLEAQAQAFLATNQVKGYLFDLIPGDRLIIDPLPMWRQLLEDLRAGSSIAQIAAAFHLGLIDAIVNMVSRLQAQYPFTQVALTGGVFQNVILTQQVSQRLAAIGLSVLMHRHVPANDGGLALGQLAIAAARQLTPLPSPVPGSNPMNPMLSI